METQRRVQMMVGAFLVSGLLIILITIFMLGADRAFFTSYVRLHAYFEQVQGLAEGSVVSLSGVTVGNIERIEFMNDRRALDVTMRIEKNLVNRIPVGSQVEIRTQGALGDKYIFIIPGSATEQPVKDGDTLEVAQATDIISIMSERGKETEKIFDIINDLHKITQTINGDRRLEKIMMNFAKASESLGSASEQAKKMATDLADGRPQEKLNRSLDKFESVMTKIDKGQGSLGALINDPSLHDRLKALLGGGARKSQVKDLLRNSIEKVEEAR